MGARTRRRCLFASVPLTSEVSTHGLGEDLGPAAGSKISQSTMVEPSGMSHNTR